jgi:hypothetical protein
VLASNGLRATNEVGAIESAASLPLRYRCLLQMDCVAALPLLASNGLAADEVGAIEFAASLRHRCLLQTDYLQQMEWVQLNPLVRCRCATAACFKWIASLRYRCLLQMDYLQQMKWVLFNWPLRCATALPLLASNGLRRCATAACFKWISCK